jgi:hypothetical protein
MSRVAARGGLRADVRSADKRRLCTILPTTGSSLESAKYFGKVEG